MVIFSDGLVVMSPTTSGPRCPRCAPLISQIAGKARPPDRRRLRADDRLGPGCLIRQQHHRGDDSRLVASEPDEVEQPWVN